MADKDVIKMLFEDESLQDLSEDFKTKATVIFETAVAKAVKDKETELQEQFDEKLEESKKTQLSEMEEQVDSYLNYVVEEWMEENKLAVEGGVQVEIAEHFLSGMKTLFEDSYVDIPESKVDVVAELAEELEAKDEELNEAIEKSITLEKALKTNVMATIVSEETHDLADSESDKIQGLIEMLDFDDEDTFRTQVKSVVETYRGKLDEKDDDDDDDDKGGDDNDDDDKDDDKKKKKKDNPFDKNESVKKSVNVYAESISTNKDSF